MERIENLVNKLKEQADRQADPRQLLVTVQLLQQELVQLIGSNKNLGTSKVSVVVPGSSSFPSHYNKYIPLPAEEPVAVTPGTAVTATVAPEPKPAPQPVSRPQPQPEPQPEPQEKIYFTLQDDGSVEEEPEPEPVPAPETIKAARPADYDPLTEIPTLSQQIQTPQQPAQPERQAAATATESSSSLNDRLRYDSGELQQRLKDTPIKDLRKAIGINDRFRFINELFRGDEAMYERSIKTINNFNIYPEAEYWISRELKVKLGWDNDSDVVLTFDQLVKRRFA